MSQPAPMRSHLSRLYELAKIAYGSIPATLSRDGYAFPARHFLLELTRRCNLRCKMCQYIDFLENTPVRQQKEGELSTEEWRAVLDQIPRFSLVSFTGGELFVRPDFMELLRLACARTRTHFITNATMVTGEVADGIVALAPRHIGFRGVNVICVSIDGPPETHDRIRRIRDGFERTTQGLRAMRAARDAAGKKCPHFVVTTVIQEDNVRELHLLPPLFREMGADVVNFVPETRMLDLPGFGERDPRSYTRDEIIRPRIDPQVLREALERAEAAAAKAGIALRLPRMPREDLIHYYNGGIDLDGYRCSMPWNGYAVGCKGEIYSCWSYPLGNVRNMSLKEVWLGERARAFRGMCRKGAFEFCPGCCLVEKEGYH